MNGKLKAKSCNRFFSGSIHLCYLINKDNSSFREYTVVLLFVFKKLVIKYEYWQLHGLRVFLTINKLIYSFDNLLYRDQYKGVVGVCGMVLEAHLYLIDLKIPEKDIISQ